MHSDWLKIVIWLGTSNQNALVSFVQLQYAKFKLRHLLLVRDPSKLQEQGLRQLILSLTHRHSKSFVNHLLHIARSSN